MKAYTVSELRENLAAALDRAERGEPVVIARRGRRFRIVADMPGRKKTRHSAFFKVKDQTLLDRGWAWEWSTPGRRMRLRIDRPSKRA